VTAQIYRNQAKVIGEIRGQLPAPRKPALRKTVNEQNGPAIWITGFDYMQLRAATTNDSVTFHGPVPLFEDLSGWPNLKRLVGKKPTLATIVAAQKCLCGQCV
jgi:hypothetical protein